MVDQQLERMELKGKMSAKIVHFDNKSDKKNDGKTAKVWLEIGVDRADGEKMFGEGFDTFAFSTLHEVKGKPGEASHTKFMLDKMKPASWMKMSKHIIEIEGERFEAKPTMLPVETIQGTDRVIVCIRIPVEADRADLVAMLNNKMGQTVSTKWNNKQGKLGLTVVKEKSKTPKATVTADSATMQ